MTEKFQQHQLDAGDEAIGDAWVEGGSDALHYVKRLIEEGGFSDKEAGALAHIVFGIEGEEHVQEHLRDRFIDKLIHQNHGDGSTL